MGDIIVTARRREESLQQTPLAVSAVDATMLARAHATDLTNIKALAPNLLLERSAVNPSSLFAYLRGFGTKTSDPAVEPALSVNIDGIYLGSNFAGVINLFDVEAVEVMRGPQGTLFGKNSPAGAINVRTRRPKNEFGGVIEASYGRFDDFQIRGYIDLPVVNDKLAATVSYALHRSDGYIRNVTQDRWVGGTDTQSLRLAFRATPSDMIDWYVSAQYDRDRSDSSIARSITTTDPEQLRIPTAIYNTPGGVPRLGSLCTRPATASACVSPPAAPYTTRNNQTPVENSGRAYSITSDLKVEAQVVDVAFLTGYRRNRQFTPLDVDGTGFTHTHALTWQKDSQFSQEIRVSSAKNGGLDFDGKLNWLLGAFYYQYEYDRKQNFNLAATRQSDGLTKSGAIFAHAEFSLTDALILSAGARQTWDSKRHNFVIIGTFPGGPSYGERRSWSNLSVDATVEYHFARDQMIYARFAQGYRGGGFLGDPTSPLRLNPYDPETVDSYEIGLKSDFFDNRARLNLTGFISKYDGLQRQLVVADPANPAVGFTQQTRNIAKATIQGIEFEAQARPISALSLRASLGYLDAKYDSFFANVTGSGADPATDNTALRFPYTSKWTATVGANFEQELGEAGTLELSADYTWRSRYNLNNLNEPFGEQKGYGLLSSTLRWRDALPGLSIAVYGQNLTNKRYLAFADTSGGIGAIVAEAMPRTWGISAGYKF
ncbi:TonB-dependent receptor [Rhizorhabdus argentea]|uniref:TonB-dependent receptor n=1 Tax=Rhizorhabdus argentea TaxID=1387174 RepID=UPI0030EB490D